MGQVVEQPLQVEKHYHVRINTGGADVNVVGTAEAVIKVERHAGISSFADDRAEGLALIGPHDDNTGIGWHFHQEGEEIRLYRVEGSRNQRFSISLPISSSIDLVEGRRHGKEQNIKNIVGDVRIKNLHATVNLQGIQGSVDVESTSGDVNLVAHEPPKNNVGYDLSSVSGRVRLTLSPSFAADLKLRTVSGSIRSDLPLEFTREYKGSVLRLIGGVRKVDYAINGGGTRVSLETASGIIDIQTQE